MMRAHILEFHNLFGVLHIMQIAYWNFNRYIDDSPRLTLYLAAPTKIEV